MQSYKVSVEHYFKEVGQKVKAGSVIELREGDALRYMESHPGLLTPALMNTMGVPGLIRKVEDGQENPVEAMSEPTPPAEVEEKDAEASKKGSQHTKVRAKKAAAKEETPPADTPPEAA